MSTNVMIVLVASVLLAGIGTILLMPHRLGTVTPRRAHAVGVILAILGVLLFATLWVSPSSAAGALSAFSMTSVSFYSLAIITLIAGILTVTRRNPVENALWFAMVLLTSAGLFLLVGAQFLAAGTVIVYAGAIVVTFLFVLMLAQSEGYALYDRMSRSPVMCVATSFAFFGAIAFAAITVRDIDEQSTPPTSIRPVTTSGLRTLVADDANQGAHRVLNLSQSANQQYETTAASEPVPGTPPPHVASLGRALFTDHLITIEFTGALLFVALVGAVAIAAPRKHVRPRTINPTHNSV